MARAHFVTYLLDNEGRPIPGATVAVREPDTSTTIAETIYAADDPDVTTKTNPFTADADGKCEIWLTNPKIVDLYVTKTGYDPATIRATAHQLTASTLTFKEAGTPLAQRAGVNFGAGFDLADDAVNDETDVSVDILELTDFIDHSARHENGGADEISLAGLDGTPTELTNHLNDAADAHDASAISVLDAGGNFAATDVEAALAEEADARQAHEADASGAHAASAISIVDAAGDFTATDVEGALAELQSDHETDATNLSNHLGDATDAHDASAISILDSGGLFTATEVEGALAEVQTQTDAVDSVLTSHVADTETHVRTVFKRKTANETVTSSTVLQDDNDLFFSIGANEVWQIELMILFRAGTGVDISWEATPGGAAQNSGLYTQIQQGGTDTNAVQFVGEVNTGGFDSNSGGLGASAGQEAALSIRMLTVNDATPRTWKFRWAQRVSDPSGTVVVAGSYLVARQVA